MKKAAGIIGKILLGVCVVYTSASLAWIGVNRHTIGNLVSTYSIVNAAYLERPDRALLWEGASRGVVAALGDPHSEYLTAQEYQQAVERLRGGFAGIGIYFAVSEEDGAVVHHVFEDSPAERAGLQTGDRLLSADGLSLDGLDAGEIAEILKGPAGTSFRLEIRREDSDPGELLLVRDYVEYRTTHADVVQGTDVGYIHISSFSMKTPEQFREDLLGMGTISGLVIDLRNNVGGQTTGAYGVAALFLPEGPIVYAESRQSIRTQEAEGGNTDLPVVVLVNDRTASAAEILAGAIQDTGRGPLVGEQTYGKGTVQQFYRTLAGDYIKLTTTRYLTPSRRSIQGVGLSPDHVVPMSDEEVFEALYGDGPPRAEGDPQLSRALAVLAGQG